MGDELGSFSLRVTCVCVTCVCVTCVSVCVTCVCVCARGNGVIFVGAFSFGRQTCFAGPK